VLLKGCLRSNSFAGELMPWP